MGQATVVGDAVILAAGDISLCGSVGDDATAAILDAHPEATVAPLGDLAYPDGTSGQFEACYGPSWGRHKARTKPVPGNHDYNTTGASGYFDYFGAAAGEVGKGYYSYDLGEWHVVALNSNCSIISCAAGSAQEQWLRADLARTQAACTLAYWHSPLFTSGQHGGNPAVRPLWEALYANGAELVLTGHDHDYERFTPQTPAGVADHSFGIRQFVVGTGGASLRAFGTTAPNSEVRGNTALGVLRLVLRAGAYDWEFLAEAGKTFVDAGSGACHGSSTETSLPSNPTLTSSHSSTWSNDRTVEVAWSGASDTDSGVDGFSYEWSQSAATVPDDLKDAEETATGTTSPQLADGSWWFHLRTRDNAGNWSGAEHLGPFRIDGTAPTNPTIASSSHTVDAWSSDPTVDLSWSGAADGASGVDGYSYQWSQSASTVPDETKDSSPTNVPLTEGSWWFHLRTMDAAGNWSGPVHLGPFKLDTSAPGNPVLSSTHPAGWSTDRTVDITWTGAVDAGSGVSGYSTEWSQVAGTSPDQTEDTKETGVTSAALADGSWWFHLRTVDAIGNWSQAAHLGPFQIDATAPTNPAISSPSHAPGDWSNDPTVAVSWTGAVDGGSGLDGFSYEWSGSALTVPDAVKDTSGESTTSGVLADGDWWFHLRTVDAIGNWSQAAHLGPFRIDTTAPINPTLSSPSHTVGAWSRESTVVIEWNGLVDQGHSYEWSESEATIPDSEVDGTEARVVSERPDGSWWFHVRTRDDAGSWSGTSHIGPFLIDTAAPETYAAATSGRLEFFASEPAVFRCSLDAEAYWDCISPVGYEGLPPGEHVFRVFARDRAGNVDPSPAELRWTIELPPPPQPQPQPQPPLSPPLLRPRPAAKKVRLCYRGRTIKVRKSKVRKYRRLGAKLGACKPKRQRR